MLILPLLHSIVVMNFWNKLFSNTKEEGPKVSFGRYTDTYKTKAQYEAWDKSLESYEEGNVLESIHLLIEYIKNNTKENIFIKQEGAELQILIYHGSKQINCQISASKELNVGFLRKAVEQSYHLVYSRYALDPQDNLCLVFDSTLAEASPYKLFYGLKELALKSDKEDDILLDEFEYLEPIQNQHIILYPASIIDIKLEFLRIKLKLVLSDNLLGSLNPKRFQGALTYIYLSTVYALDYLVKPEGPVMDILTRMHMKYFEAPNDHIENKVSLFVNGFLEMDQMTDSEISDELYEVISTFGITSPSSHKNIAEFIEKEIAATNWYEENNHDFICISICNYIAGYCLYNYAMPAPDKDLFHLYFEITEPEFFKKLGFKNEYRISDKSTLCMSAIYDEVEMILRKHKPAFPSLPVTATFDERSVALFLKSYLLFIKNLSIE
jgi:hypothetical protein